MCIIRKKCFQFVHDAWYIPYRNMVAITTIRVLYSYSMRIAFVGKGGAGKTTMAALITQLLATNSPVLAIDADINMHMAELLGLKDIESMKLISEKQPSQEIRTWLRGSNKLIPTNGHFKKQPNSWLYTHQIR